MQTTRILIAHELERSEVITSALKDFDLVTVFDIRSAEYQVMEDGINLFVIGIHFDESRALELVNFIRQNPRHKTTPIVLVRLLSSALADFIRSSADALIKVGKVNHYLELVDHPSPDIVILNTVTETLLENLEE